MEQIRDDGSNLAEVRETVAEKAKELRSRAEDYYVDIQDRVGDLDLRIRDAVSARPIAFVAGAFAVGFLFARTFKAWRRSW